MAYDSTTYVPYPGTVATPAQLNQLITNLLWVRGQDSGQTEIECLAPFLVDQYVESTDASALNIRKKYSGSDVPEVDVIAEMIDDDAFSAGDSVSLYGILGESGGLQENYGVLVADWREYATGRLRVQTLGPTSAVLGSESLASAMTIDEDGQFGFLIEAPRYAFDVGPSALNISGDYYQNDLALTDWTLTPGSPDNVSRTGNARVFGAFISTVATGTAPLVVASPDECPNLDVDYLDGYAWHGGLYSEGYANDFGSSDTATTASVDLDIAGEWTFEAAGNFSNTGAGDQNKTFTAKIKIAGGAQIGATAEVTLDEFVAVWGASETKPFSIVGAYTASGGETVRVEVAVGSGTAASNSCGARIIATWEGP